MKKFFGTDGIRGKANFEPLTPSTITKIAQAIGAFFKRNSAMPRVVIGKDTRISCDMIESALCAGFTSIGLDVVLLDILPTPAVALLTKKLNADVGIMISASHNPFSDNGIKLFGPDGFKLSDAIEKEIEDLIEQEIHCAQPEAIGKISRFIESPENYKEFLHKTLLPDINLKPLKIVVDCAHGAAYQIAPQILSELGADIIALHTSPTGCNINDNAGATHPYVISEQVLLHKADLGIAFDGDADRVIFCDEQGYIIDGDQVLALLASHYHKQNKLSGETVVATVMSNLAFENFLKDLKIDLIRTSVGDRYVTEKMREKGFILGGEQSGHIILGEFSTAGDGILTALHVLQLLASANKPASKVLRVFKPAPQILKNVSLDPIILQSDVVKIMFENVRMQLGNQGRLLVRASGTEPLVRVMVEAAEEIVAKEIVDNVIKELKASEKTGVSTF